jgi:hypothetical protein
VGISISTNGNPNRVLRIQFAARRTRYPQDQERRVIGL